MSSQEITISFDTHTVTGLLRLPTACQLLLVLGHGAGAGMRHSLMEQLADDLAGSNIGSLRYNFPYIEMEHRSPGAPALSQATVRAATHKAQELAPGIPLMAGGKSYGGRMTSLAQAVDPLPNVNGLVFYGFPLHAPGRPGDKRGEHLKNVKIPMLFMQGTRDKLADLSLLQPLCDTLGPRTTLQIIEGADHGFNMLKSSTKDTATVRKELAEQTAMWFGQLGAS